MVQEGFPKEMPPEPSKAGKLMGRHSRQREQHGQSLGMKQWGRRGELQAIWRGWKLEQCAQCEEPSPEGRV